MWEGSQCLCINEPPAEAASSSPETYPSTDKAQNDSRRLLNAVNKTHEFSFQQTLLLQMCNKDAQPQPPEAKELSVH